MMKRMFVMGACAACLLSVAAPAGAAQLMSVEEALKSVFGDDVEFRSEVKVLRASQLLQMEAELDKQLMTEDEKSAWGCPIDPAFEFDPSTGESEPVTAVEFFFATSEGEGLGVGVVAEAPGKWDVVGYLVGMDMKGTVTRIEMIASSEKRGRDVARRSFMKQFEGTTADDIDAYMDDIVAVSGATVTSNSACAAVTKAVILYREFYLKELETSPEPAAPAGEVPAGAAAEADAVSEDPDSPEPVAPEETANVDDPDVPSEDPTPQASGSD